jgi:hypothetical protein
MASHESSTALGLAVAAPAAVGALRTVGLAAPVDVWNRERYAERS